jgi:hypothetical protein
MGWFSNVVSVILPGVPQTFEALGKIGDGELPLPTNPLPLPDPVTDYVLPDRAKNYWNEHLLAENDKFHGLWNGGIKSVGDFFTGVGEIFSGDFKKGAGHIIESAVGGAESGIGIAAIELRGKIAGIQNLQTRGLTGPEREYLTSIFGDSIDLDKIRIREGDAGLASTVSKWGGKDRALTDGNTIYMKKSPDNPADWPEGYTAEDRQKGWLELLAHESTHVWQFQNFGASYITDSLVNQIFPPAIADQHTINGRPLKNEYDWMAGMDAGKSWEDLNPEQQAELIETAVKFGFFPDPSKGHMADDQHVDRTAYIQEAIRKLQARVG